MGPWIINPVIRDPVIRKSGIRTNEVVYNVKEQSEGTITELTAHSSLHYLLASSTNATLGVYDLRKENTDKKNKLYALSDEMESDLNCLCLIKDEKFVAVGSDEGP